MSLAEEGVSVERPLHVRVAEALGCAPVEYGVNGGFWKCGCAGGRVHGQEYTDGYVSDDLWRYDQDWVAVGRLIEEYGIGLDATPQGEWEAFLVNAGWDSIFECWNESSTGTTPLVAVCNLILAMMARGR